MNIVKKQFSILAICTLASAGNATDYKFEALRFVIGTCSEREFTRGMYRRAIAENESARELNDIAARISNGALGLSLEEVQTNLRETDRLESAATVARRKAGRATRAYDSAIVELSADSKEIGDVVELATTAKNELEAAQVALRTHIAAERDLLLQMRKIVAYCKK
ncbi:MAG: hypothetical protein OXI46_11355 [Gemmatimonadota bacterium]|nr:hypothetical protein [Gemmatimonadota bacterium]